MQSQAAEDQCLVAQMYMQMQGNHATNLVWLPEYKEVQLPLAWNGEVTTYMLQTTHTQVFLLTNTLRALPNNTCPINS
jgi:hypothetical protein